MHFMMKGEQTELTYKVVPYRVLSLWISARVYEPYIQRAKFFGLIPSRLRYRKVFDGGRACEMHAEHPTPEDYREVCALALRAYEKWKLAWEK